MKIKSYPNYIAIIGGGRWARVIIEVLCEVVPRKTNINIYSPHNADGMSKWLKQKKFQQKIKISKKISNFDNSKIEAAIIVNAAKDHEWATKNLLVNSIPVLVEKPLSLSYLATKNLMDLANFNKTLLCSAHVFLFAQHIVNFSNDVKKSGDIKSIYIEWRDEKNENRYGEIKSYDAGLPIYFDCLPHIFSIISTVVSLGKVTIHDVSLFRGGSKVQIRFNVSGIDCEVKLERNSKYRSRLFSIEKINQKSILDFSKDTVVTRDEEKIVNSLIESQHLTEKPVALMLKAFMNQLRLSMFDSRLDPSLSLYVNKFIEQVSHFYNTETLLLLKSKLISPVLLDDDLRYLLSEVILFNQTINLSELESKIENVQNAFSGDNGDYWYKKLDESNPFDIIRKASSVSL